MDIIQDMAPVLLTAAAKIASAKELSLSTGLWLSC